MAALLSRTNYETPTTASADSIGVQFDKLFGKVSRDPWNIAESVRQKQLVPKKPPAVKTASVPGGPGQSGTRGKTTITQIGSKPGPFVAWLKRVFAYRAAPWWEQAWGLSKGVKADAGAHADQVKRPNTATSGFSTKATANVDPHAPTDVVDMVTTMTINGPAHYTPTAGVNGTILDDSRSPELRKYVDDSYGSIAADSRAPMNGTVGVAGPVDTAQAPGPFPGPLAAASGIYVKPAQIVERNDVPPGFVGPATPVNNVLKTYA